MKVQYLEIVTNDIQRVCDHYATIFDLSFAEVEPALGNARVAIRADGSLVGVRAPMSDSESPLIRPYWLVADIEQALADLSKQAAQIIHPPLKLAGFGTFAIYVAGGVEQGLWQT